MDIDIVKMYYAHKLDKIKSKINIGGKLAKFEQEFVCSYRCRYGRDENIEALELCAIDNNILNIYGDNESYSKRFEKIILEFGNQEQVDAIKEQWLNNDKLFVERLFNKKLAEPYINYIRKTPEADVHFLCENLVKYAQLSGDLLQFVDYVKDLNQRDYELILKGIIDLNDDWGIASFARDVFSKRINMSDTSMLCEYIANSNSAYLINDFANKLDPKYMPQMSLSMAKSGNISAMRRFLLENNKADPMIMQDYIVSTLDKDLICCYMREIPRIDMDRFENSIIHCGDTSVMFEYAYWNDHADFKRLSQAIADVGKPCAIYRFAYHFREVADIKVLSNSIMQSENVTTYKLLFARDILCADDSVLAEIIDELHANGVGDTECAKCKFMKTAQDDEEMRLF